MRIEHQHVYEPEHPTPNSVGLGTGPCRYPGCTEPPHSTVHGALDLGVLHQEKPHERMDP